MATDTAIIARDLDLISTNLAQSQHLDDVIYFFLDKKIINLQIYDELSKSNETESVRAKRLVTYITENPDTTHEFIEALLKEGLTDIAGHINPNTVDSLPSANGNGITAEKLPFIPQLKETPCTPIIPHQPMGLPSDLPDIHNRNVALTIRVKPSQKIFGSTSNDKDIYKNSSSPQGFIFIANFESFDNNTYPSRPGSSIDVTNLQELFVQIGYKVAGPYINQTKYDLITAIEKFRETMAMADIDSCVVAIMSHGRGEMAFVTSDNKVIKYNDILELFNNKGCPSLFGKPKVFIFQCCRGPIADEGVGFTPQRVSHVIQTSTDASAFGLARPETSSPSFTDMYIIHSSLQGFVSYRCPDRGSWLIEALCVEFMNNCCEKDVDSLMRLVSKRLKTLFSDRGKKQICETRNIGFDKLLYFNPISRPNVSDTGQCRDEPDMGFALGSANHYKAFRRSRATAPDHPIRHKRQLSNVSITEGLNLCQSLMNYLQINEMTDMRLSVEEIKTKIEEKKLEREGKEKRRKIEDED